VGRAPVHPAHHLAGLHRQQRTRDRRQPHAAAPGGLELDSKHLGEWAQILFNQAVFTLGARIEDPPRSRNG
jgi:hypothetical protein